MGTLDSRTSLEMFRLLLAPVFILAVSGQEVACYAVNVEVGDNGHGFRVTNLELHSRAYSPAVACWTGRLNSGISVIRVVFALIPKASFVQISAPTKLEIKDLYSSARRRGTLNKLP